MGKIVLFYSSVKDKELFKIQQFYRIDIQILNELGYGVLLSNRVLDAFRFWKYDFVFAYFYRYSLFVAFIARMFGKKVYFTGGIDALDRNLSTKKEFLVQEILFKLCYFFSEKCIIVSRTDEANVRPLVNGRKLSYSEHTINAKQFACDVHSKINLCTSIAWQATKANVQRKGVDNAIRLFARLIRLPQYADYKLVIIGKMGDGTIYLQGIITELGIANSVFFTDSIPESEKVDYLKRSKIYFQLSKFEGFGVAALEALSASNIVIHSGKGGLSNPIYQMGVQINIDQQIEQMFGELKEKLASFDEAFLNDAQRIVCRDYDNERRKNEFRLILSA